MKWKITVPSMVLAVLVSIAVDEYSGQSHQAMAQGQGPAAMVMPTNPPGPPQADACYTPTLKASLRLEWMSIPGFSFWGGRITDIDANSPLHQANLRVGDVVTRLDGVSIAKGKYWSGQYWELPQIERHFGPTELRFIRTGHQNAENVQVNLGASSFPSFPGPVVP